METSALIDLKNCEIGNISAFKKLMTDFDYLHKEYEQSNSRSNKFYVSEILDGETIMILVMAN